ncbi:hypothetical protein [uncultured Clostridium sp.]|jgi:predicted HicB family RNase H-like nuclease|nr:hypothetical protein [uncultured Clostridium sp.]
MKVITIRLDEELHNKLKLKTESEDRSIQRHLIRLIKKDVDTTEIKN